MADVVVRAIMEFPFEDYAGTDDFPVAQPDDHAVPSDLVMDLASAVRKSLATKPGDEACVPCGHRRYQHANGPGDLGTACAFCGCDQFLLVFPDQDAATVRLAIGFDQSTVNRAAFDALDRILSELAAVTRAKDEAERERDLFQDALAKGADPLRRALRAEAEVAALTRANEEAREALAKLRGIFSIYHERPIPNPIPTSVAAKLLRALRNADRVLASPGAPTKEGKPSEE